MPWIPHVSGCKACAWSSLWRCPTSNKLDKSINSLPATFILMVRTPDGEKWLLEAINCRSDRSSTYDAVLQLILKSKPCMRLSWLVDNSDSTSLRPRKFNVRDIDMLVTGFFYEIDVALVPIWPAFLLAQQLEICFFVSVSLQQLQLQAYAEFPF